jgi:co-chaperonin GroES (HSP10)
MKLRPTSDNVLVRLDPLVTTTASGLALGAPVREFGDKLISGVVVEVGPGGYGYDAGIIDERKPLPPVKYFPVDVEPGDRVLFGRHAGEPVDIGTTGVATHPKNESGDEYRIISNSQIECVL